MVTVPLNPQGLLVSRNRNASSPTFQANRYKIKKGYATAIGLGDIVAIGTGGNQGYVTLCADNPAAGGILGVFAGIMAPPGYFDSTAQQTMYGLNGSWPANANPATDIDVLVYDDPQLVFRAQIVGAFTWAQLDVGQNINWTGGTNGAPNAAGISALSLNGGSINTTATLPFRIQQIVDVAPYSGSISGGGSTDPAVVNPWVEVTINPNMSSLLAGLGI